MSGLPAGTSSSNGGTSSSLSFARSFDAFAYKRLKDIIDFTEASTLGAILTIIGTFFISFLFIAELLAYLTVNTLTSVELPSPITDNQPIKVTFNITFPRLPCNLITIENYDSLSSKPKNLLSSVHRYKIDSNTGTALMRILHDETNTNNNIDDSITNTNTNNLELPPNTVDFSNTQNSQLLDGDNFDLFLLQNQLTLVAFGAPWCPYSQQLGPVLEETAKIIANVEGVRIGRVDCTQLASQSLCQKQHIAAFPTIVLFKGHSDHSHIQYNGLRTSEALLAFLVRAKQNSDLVTNPDEITSGDASAHAEAISRSLQLMTGPSDTEADPADPGPAWSLIEAIHKAGIHAPGDLSRAAKSLLGIDVMNPNNNPENNKNNDVFDNSNQRIQGCQIAGQLDLRRVSGTLRFVIKPTSTLSTEADSNGNINVVNNGDVSIFSTNINTSHIVHNLFWGPKLTSYQLSRLPDNHLYEYNLHRLRNKRFVSTTETGSNATHIHNLRIIPTEFSFRSGYTVDTFQYSSQSYTESMDNNNNPSMINFNYDLSPLAVSVNEVRKPFYSFLTSCCAIIGGVFTVISLIDTILHSVKYKVKAIMGKQY